MGIGAYLIGRVLRVGTDVQSYGSSDTTSDSMMYQPWFGPAPPMLKQREAVTLEQVSV